VVGVGVVVEVVVGVGVGVEVKTDSPRLPIAFAMQQKRAAGKH